MKRPTQAVTIEDLRRTAKARLPEFVFAPMDTGAGNGAGPARNVGRFQDQRLVSRVLADTSAVSAQTALFGRTYGQSFGISAVGVADNFRHGADRMLAQSAREADIPFMLSGCSNASVEAVSKIAPDHLWAQLYAAKDPALTEDLVRRARDSGVEVLAFTIDMPIRSKVEWLARAGVSLPANIEPRSLPYAALQLLGHPAWSLDAFRHGLPPMLDSWRPYAEKPDNALSVAQRFHGQVPSQQTWAVVERVRSLWPGTLVLKGVMHPEDAVRAVELGADAVTVSNHGGNKLDCLSATIDVLPAVKQAVGSRIPVLFDGGIRRGVDIVVAHCLGADFCFVGRATLYGVIAHGQAGADRAVQILSEEVREVMILIGAASISDLNPGFLSAPRPASV